jgi:hypothetical protein
MGTQSRKRFTHSASPGTEKSFWGTIQQIKENQDEIERMKQWKPRTIEIGTNMLATGEPEDFAVDAPECTLAQFFGYWKRRNYGYMARCLGYNFTKHTAKPAVEVKQEYSSKNLVQYHWIAITDIAHSVTEIETVVVYQEESQERTKTINFRLINEDDNGKSVARGNPRGKWFILNWCVG